MYSDEKTGGLVIQLCLESDFPLFKIGKLAKTV